MKTIESMVADAFKAAARRELTTNSNSVSKVKGVVSFPARITARERHTLASLILYKASMLRTTEAWVKESAETHFGINDLDALRTSDYEAVVNFLMLFEDEDIGVVNA